MRGARRSRLAGYAAAVTAASASASPASPAAFFHALASAATIVYFRGRADFNPIKHLVLPVLGGGLMIALLIGQILENRVAPFDWMPWALVVYLIVLIAVAYWLAANRPEALQRAGAIMATGELEEERALHGSPEPEAG